MKTETKAVTIRFPVSLLEQIRGVAQQNNRSLNGEIVTAVAEHVKKERKRH